MPVHSSTSISPWTPQLKACCAAASLDLMPTPSWAGDLQYMRAVRAAARSMIHLLKLMPISSAIAIARPHPDFVLQQYAMGISSDLLTLDDTFQHEALLAAATTELRAGTAGAAEAAGTAGTR